MIPTLILGIFGVGVPDWLKGWVKWLIDAALLIALLAGTYFLIHHDGEKKGAAKVTAQVEKQHEERKAEAVADTGKAQATVDAIGATTHHSNELATQFVQAQIEELRHATDVTPAPAGAAPVVLDVDGVSAPLDALIDRANRAAEAADAQP